jgi:PEP-CTERM motif
MKKLLCVLSVLLVMSALPALADSISPASVTATLPVGGSATVHKTVTIDAGAPTSSKVDVFFLSDTTGSMGGIIGTVAASASGILAGTTGLGDVAWGVGAYRDVGDAYVYQRTQAITTNAALVQAGINSWAAGGGGDYQEAELYALHTLATDPLTGWRSGSARILVWMGDASGHDPSVGITEATATADLVAMGIKALAVDVGTMNDTGQAGRIATATGGHLYTGINTASIVATISAAIGTAFLTYSNVSLDTTEAGPNVSVGFTPGSYIGSFDRSIARTFGFDVTFTGVSEGTDGFNIYALVDGGRVATESDRITVGAVPEPGSMFLLGTVLVGIAAGLRRRRQ